MSLFLKPPAVVENNSGTVYGDLSQIVSIANRRFYRQGLNWAVASIRIMTTTVNDLGVSDSTVLPKGRVIVSKVPTTWIASNAWEKAFRHWQKMNKESEGVPGKFHDFKVFLDEGHRDSTSTARLLPFALPQNGDLQTLGTSIGLPGDWDYSHFVVPDADNADPTGSQEFDIMFVGDNYPSTKPIVSLIQGYANSRAIGAAAFIDPNVPDEMADASSVRPENWLTALFNEGIKQDQDVIENLLEENVRAPYPYENDTSNPAVTRYPGGQQQLNGPQVHALEPITGSTIGGTTYIQGGSFPCGLIRFDFSNFLTGANQNQQNIIQIDLVPGDHRGYLCEPMTEM